MFRYIVKVAVYYAILLFFLSVGWLPAASALSMLGAAAVLAAVNTLIRPVLVAVALPFNAITFGIASVFANLLSLVIASAIMGGAMQSGFWIMLLIALSIQTADDGIRLIRQAIRRRRVQMDA